MRMASTPARIFLGLVTLASCAPPQAVAVPGVTTRPLAAGPSQAAAPLRDDSLVVPCSSTGDDATLAKQKIDALSPRVEALRANDSPNALGAEIDALLSTPCYALARADGDARLQWSSGLALRTWWTDGGHAWLAHFTTIDADSDRRIIGTPPTPRATFTLDTARPDEPLRPLLCPTKAVDDRSCGVETAGFRIRADRADPHVTDAGDRGRYCADAIARDTSGASAYEIFRACVSAAAGKDVLPLGAFQAPKDGWFIVTHSVFIALAGCRENVAAYDLATGSAYYVGCRPTAPPRLAIGRVALGALREAAWMSMLQHETELGIRTHGRWFDLPKGIALAKRPGEKTDGYRVSISTSDAPALDWAWLRSDGGSALHGQASGRFDTSSSSLSAHASQLLAIVDATFQEGCTPAPLPGPLPWQNLGPTVTGNVRSDVGPLFHFVDHARAMLANAPRTVRTPCALIP